MALGSMKNICLDSDACNSFDGKTAFEHTTIFVTYFVRAIEDASGEK